MAKMLLLAKVLLKVSFGGTSQDLTSSRNKITRWLLYGLLLVAFVPLMFSLYFLFDYTLELLISIDQVSILTNVVLAGVTIMVFVLSLLQIPSIYYYARDTEGILVLPIKPHQILGAKFLTTLVYQYALVIFMILPLGAAMSATNPTIVYYLVLLVVSIFLPVLPLLISSLIVMFLMNFVPMFKNKNFMNIIIGLVTVILAVALSMSMNTIGEVSPEAIVELLQQGNDTIAATMFTFLPTINWASEALNQMNFLSLLLVIIVNLGLFGVYCMFAQGFFLNGAQGINEAVRSRKSFSRSSLRKMTNRQPVMWALIKRELIELIRTPAYLLNCVSITILMPALLIGPLFFSNLSSDADLVAIQEGLMTFINQNNNLIYLAVVGGFFMGIFSGGINSVSSTAISRDAYQLDALKSYPIAANTIVFSKVLTGTLISLITVACTVLIGLYALDLPWSFYLLFILIALLSTLAVNMMMIILDIVRPKLNWTSETQAVKQNLNSMLSILFAMAIPVAYGFVVLYFELSILLSVSLTLLVILLMMGSLLLFLKLYQKHLFNYN